MPATRRQFLSGAGLTAAGAVVAGWMPRGVFAQAALGKKEIQFGAGKEVDPATAGIDPQKLKALGELFEKQIRDGLHPGAQLAVMKGDQLVFDRWGGIAIKPTTPITHDTKMLLFSSTKPLGGACTMMLVESGDLEIDAPLVRYWPNFVKGDAGKKAVTVRHVLGHQAGLPTGPEDFNYEQMADSAAAMRAMERLPLKWEPGSKFEYHPLNYGWLLGELIRRVSGMPVDRFMKEQLLDPLGCVNASLGVPPDKMNEYAFIYRMNDREHPIEIWNSPGVRMATCVASHGHMPASDLVRFYGMMARGGVTDRGKRLLKEETVKLMTHAGRIEKSGDKSPYGLGFFMEESEKGNAATSVFGHGGSGTSFGKHEPGKNISAAFICNGHQPEEVNGPRLAAIWDAARALG